MAARQSPVKEALKAKLSKGVSESEIEKVIESIAKELGKQPRAVKALFSRYLKAGIIKKEGGKYVWSE